MMELTKQEKAVCIAVTRRASALLEDLRRHVALPTGHGNIAALDESRVLLTQRLGKLGAQVTSIPGDPKAAWLYETADSGVVPPTAVARRAVAGAHSVLLCGHLDTVHDPRGAFRELVTSPDGKTATGPGCVDMKGGLVIAVAALEALDEAGVNASWGFILNSDEETGSYHSAAALHAEASRGYTAGLVLEPALPGGELVIERPGSGQFMIETRGRAAHVGRDFASGISAVNALATCITRAAAMAEPRHG